MVKDEMVLPFINETNPIKLFQTFLFISVAGYWLLGVLSALLFWNLLEITTIFTAVGVALLVIFTFLVTVQATRISIKYGFRAVRHTIQRNHETKD